MEFTDHEIPSMLDQRIIKAKKTHKCVECYRDIRPGESYQYTAGVWDGDFQVFKTCIHCVEAQKFILEQCDGFLFRGAMEELQNYPYFRCSYLAARFLVGMRRKWKAFKGDGLMKVTEA